MLENPMYVRMPTEDCQNYLENRSAAEAVIGVLIDAQDAGWLRLHGFVVLPDAVEMVISPIRQSIAGVIAHIQAETTPILSVLLPEAMMIWSQDYLSVPVMTQKALDARLKMLTLAPIAYALSEEPAEYIYCSANLRYEAHVTRYTGFARMLPMDREALETGELHLVQFEENGHRSIS